MSNMSDLVNILRSVPGYILNPAGTYEKNRNEGYSYAIMIFVVLYVIIWFFSKFLLLTDDILNGRTIDSDFLSLWFTLYQVVYFSIEILIIVFVIHFGSKFENKNANFVDSFKITFISYAIFIFIFGLTSVMNALFNILDIKYNTGSLTCFVIYPLFILALLLFIRVSAEGIRVLHDLSKVKSYLIAAISILAANAAIYLNAFWLEAIILT